MQSFKNGCLKEHLKMYYTPDGMLKEKVTYSSDFAYSQHELFSPSDKVSAKFSATKGCIEGEYIRYGSSELPIEISYYDKAGKWHGPRKLYFDLEKPVLKEESYYQFGKMDGLCIRYTPNGKIAEKAHYQMGKKVIIPALAQVAFAKRADKDKRDNVSDNLIKLRRLGKRTEAMVVAQKFHLENSDIPRRTALKFNKQKTRA